MAEKGDFFMPRKPELSATQLVASGLATVTATVGASYLGVAGTLWGAAFMSVASTAGVAVYKHYLEQGKEQIWEKTHAPPEVEEAAADVTRADPTRTVMWPAGAHAGDPTEVIAGVRPEPEDAATRPAGTAGPSRAANTMEWLKRRWMVLAASSVAVFAVVMGGVTLVEAIADQPVSSIVGATDDKGTSFSNVGHKTKTTPDDEGPTDRPSGKRTEPTGTSTPDPTSPPTHKPRTPPVEPPSPPPTKAPVVPPAPKPSQPPGQGPGQPEVPKDNGKGRAPAQPPADQPGAA